MNIHIDVPGPGDRNAKRLNELLDTFGLQQSVSQPTHRDGHTLDVVTTRSDLPSPTVIVRPSDKYFDHSLVLFQLPLPRPPSQYVNVCTRAWKGFDRDRFRDDLLSSQLCSLWASVDWLQQTYDDTLSALLDKHAPRRTVRRHQPTTPWFDNEYAAAKCRARTFERRYRRTRIAADRFAWIAKM